MFENLLENYHPMENYQLYDRYQNCLSFSNMEIYLKIKKFFFRLKYILLFT